MKVPVDEAPAGSAMDAAVAEALGWEPVWVRIHPPFGRIPNHFSTREECEAACISEQHPKQLWIWEGRYLSGLNWSTDIASAWELLEGFTTQIATLSDGMWGVILGTHPMEPTRSVRAETTPLAICRAFLKVNGIDHVEVGDEDVSR